LVKRETGKEGIRQGRGYQECRDENRGRRGDRRREETGIEVEE
jgi:hypothetical protein